MATFLSIWVALNIFIKFNWACKAVYFDDIPIRPLDVCLGYIGPMQSYQYSCMDRIERGDYIKSGWQNNNCSGNATGSSGISHPDDQVNVQCDDCACDYVIINDSIYEFTLGDDYHFIYPWKEFAFVVGECYLFNNSWCSGFCTNSTFGVMCFDNELCETDPIVINYGKFTPTSGLMKGSYQISECTNPESRLSIKTAAPQDNEDNDWMIVGITFITLLGITFITSIIAILFIYHNKYKKDGYRKTTALDADNDVINQK